MLCRRCAGLAFLGGVEPPRPFVVEGVAWERTCRRCGVLIARPELTGSIVQKITQLARFGLGGGGAPVLKWGEPATKDD
jgi:hypothetical protein